MEITGECGSGKTQLCMQVRPLPDYSTIWRVVTGGCIECGTRRCGLKSLSAHLKPCIVGLAIIDLQAHNRALACIMHDSCRHLHNLKW